jgi:hypothetical protein
VADIPDYGSARLDEAAIGSPDLSRPVLLAEIAPGRHNLIDGHHRVAKARRDGVPTVHARRIACPRHVPFLTSSASYQKYVEYWNSKVEEMRSVRSLPAAIGMPQVLFRAHASHLHYRVLSKRNLG